VPDSLHYRIWLIVLDEVTRTTYDLPLAVCREPRQVFLHGHPRLCSHLALAQDHERLASKIDSTFSNLPQALAQTGHFPCGGPKCPIGHQ